MPNRDVPVEEDTQEDAVARRVLQYFAEAHTELEFSAQGKLTFQGMCAAFTVQCGMARDAAQVPRAAMLGAGPWHLAMLSAGLLVLEIGFGQHDDSAELRGRKLQIQEDHVARAYDLLCLLLAQRELWQGIVPEADLDGAVAAAADATQAQRGLALASRPPRTGHLYPEFVLTQPPPDPALLSEAPDARPLLSPTGFAGAGMSLAEEGEEAGAALAEDDLFPPTVRVDTEGGMQAPGGPDASGAIEKALLPTDPEVPKMETGYGPEGASVQRSDAGEVVFSDRAIMRATLLRGQVVVYGTEVCGSMAVRASRQEGGKRQRTSLRLSHWEVVMQAGLGLYRVGEFVHSRDARPPYKTGKSYVKLHFPPDGNVALATAYSNRLMRLCQLSYAAVVEAATRKAEKMRASAPADVGQVSAAGGAQGGRPEGSSGPAASPVQAEPALGHAAGARAGGSTGGEVASASSTGGEAAAATVMGATRSVSRASRLGGIAPATSRQSVFFEAD